MHKRFSHIRDLLSGHSLTRSLLEQDREALRLVSDARAALPEALRGHCVDASIADGKLRIFFDSPAWQTRARFLSEQIISAMGHYAISEIEVKTRMISPSQSMADLAKPPAPRLSRSVVEHLYEAAAHQSDPKLSEAFRRLAHHHAPHGGGGQSG